jgi:hypothetical protein
MSDDEYQPDDIPDDSPDPRQSELADLREVMDSKAGRRFMYRLLHGYCAIRRTSYAQHTNDSAFNAGMQSVGFSMSDNLDDACFELKQVMEREARFTKED